MGRKTDHETAIANERGDAPKAADVQQFLEVIIDQVLREIGPLPEGWIVQPRPTGPEDLGPDMLATYRVNVLARVETFLVGVSRYRITDHSYRIHVDPQGVIVSVSPPWRRVQP